MAPSCAIDAIRPTRASEPCGVQARGRCEDCGRAFCGSHRSLFLNNVCSECQTQRDKDLEAGRSANREYLLWKAVGELRASGIEPVEIHLVKTEVEFKEKFGRLRVFELPGHRKQWPTVADGRHNFIETVTWSGTGWLIGEFSWRYEISALQGRTHSVRPWRTVLAEQPGLFARTAGLVRIFRDTKRYGFWIHGFDGVITSGYAPVVTEIRKLTQTTKS